MPSGRRAWLRSAKTGAGYEEWSTKDSWAIIVRSTAWRKPSTSKVPSESPNESRLMLARLQADPSTNRNSEHGFDALMRPDAGHVCQELIVVSN